ncbi:hypothetical protein ACMWOT_002670 [Yersinia enterocolitica]
MKQASSANREAKTRDKFNEGGKNCFDLRKRPDNLIIVEQRILLYADKGHLMVENSCLLEQFVKGKTRIRVGCDKP